MYGQSERGFQDEPPFGSFWKRLFLCAVLAALIFGYFTTGIRVGSDCRPAYNRNLPSDCATWTTFRHGEKPVTRSKTHPRILRH
jgi:hypothetical protein